MWKIRVTIALLFLCSSTTYAKIVADNDGVVESIATPIMDEILAGFKENNYIKYSKYFDQEMLNAIPKEKFKITREQILYDIGNYQSKRYLGYLNQNNMTVILYKGKFDKFMGDVLIKIVLTREGDLYYVKGLWFQ